jgi:hypothetical protein
MIMNLTLVSTVNHYDGLYHDGTERKSLPFPQLRGKEAGDHVPQLPSNALNTRLLETGLFMLAATNALQQRSLSHDTLCLTAPCQQQAIDRAGH